MASGVAEMAKGRPRASGKKTPPTQGQDDRVVIAHIKGTPDYAAWLEALHQKTHIPKAALFRIGLAEWAERNGHASPPEL
jgi:hypothetical protein